MSRSRERERDGGRDKSHESPQDYYPQIIGDSPARDNEKARGATKDTIGNPGGTHLSPPAATNSSSPAMNPGSPAQVVDPLSFAEDGAFSSGSAPPPVYAPWLSRLPPLDGILSMAAVRARTISDIPTEHPRYSGETIRYNDPGSCPNCGQQDHPGRFGGSDFLKFHMIDTLQ